MTATITAYYAGLLALLIIALAYRVASYRRGNKIGIGDNGDPVLQVRVRAHANAIEYVPISKT